MTEATATSPFIILAKPAGARCNLECTYCFYLEKEALYPDRQTSCMPEDVLENFIRHYIQAQPGEHVAFAWQGGEPTVLGVDYYRRVVDLQRQYAVGKTIENAFQTNGVLLDDAWCSFFKENDFLVGLSIDGPEERHNTYRLNKGGKGTFGQVMLGLDHLLKHGVAFNTLTVLHNRNADDPIGTYRFLKQIGSRYQQYIPIMERVGQAGSEDGLTLVSPAYEGSADVTDWSISSDQYGRFLITVFDEWVRRDVARVFVQIFDATLSVWAGKNAGICLFDKTCGRGPVMEANGDLYACDHYVFPHYKLGNIIENDLIGIVDSVQQQAFGLEKSKSLPQQCLNCDVRFACHGGCPKHRIEVTEDGEPGLNYFCAAYKGFFHHTDPYMRFMAGELADGRAPARVMSWVREKDLGFPALKVGRNDPCPCGSGEKFKKCCGPLRTQKLLSLSGKPDGEAVRDDR